MKYLLDVNALLAWRHPGSTDHAAFHAWAAQEKFSALATCAHAELGFLRVSIQVFGYSAEAAVKALAEIKRDVGGFVSTSPSPKLPSWCRKGAQTSDAYLAQMAASAGLTLATFDTGIPGSHLIA